MAPNNDDDARRNRPDAEDNPFVAFRRFADSQVSSLLNTVFTLPVTLATLNNAHHAREQCLFGQADSTQCEKLRQLEDDVAKIRAEGRELYQVGDMQSVLKKGEELMKLDRQADELRKNIVEDARRRDTGDTDPRARTELVERVGKEKGQHWGWSWSWGFPASFDEEERARSNEPRRSCRSMRRRQQQRLEEDFRESTDDEWQHFNARWDDIKKKMNEELPRVENRKSKESMWYTDNPPRLFDELGNIVQQFDRFLLPRSASDEESYSPRALEDDEKLRKAGVPWRDAYEDLVRSQRGEQDRQLDWNECTGRNWNPNMPLTMSRKPRGEYPKKVVAWEGEETSDEPSYEYAHDHEDQHDDPPTPKVGQGKFTEGMPATEVEAYERLLGPVSSPEPTDDARPSILSTLTTTERSVAADGTTTTKVMLKKRFADGREESSETVHTQRGQESDTSQDPWKALQEQFSSPSKRSTSSQEMAKKKDTENKKGWFWSS